MLRTPPVQQFKQAIRTMLAHFLTPEPCPSCGRARDIYPPTPHSESYAPICVNPDCERWLRLD